MKVKNWHVLLWALLIAARAVAQDATKVIDDFESAERFSRWQFNGTGKISLQSERVKQGRQAMRFDCPLALVDGKERYQIANLYLDKEDWRGFNRISFWVWFDAPGHNHVPFGLGLHNANDSPEGRDEKEKKQARIQTAAHSVVAKPGEWVHVAWDIPEWRRDKVVLLQLALRSAGTQPGESDHMTGYFDDLRLEKVTPPKYLGWDTAPGLVSFVHTGYLPRAEKIAVFPDSTNGTPFRILEKKTGREAFTGELKAVPICDVRPKLADFTRLQTPGTYRIEAEGLKSEAFRIADDALASPTRKVLNFIYSQRCGIEVPGVHGVCHLDNCAPILLRERSWMREAKAELLKQLGNHVDFTGGWHDAGITDQYPPNSAGITYGLCRLAETGAVSWDRNGDGKDDILDEAEWGAQWLLKLLMPDGDLYNGSPGEARWTDNKAGTPDDRHCDACGTYPQYHFEVIAAQGKVARLFKDLRPELAKRSIENARKTWDFLMTKRWKDRAGSSLDTFAPCAIAGVEMWRATGEPAFKQTAIEMLNLMASCQETSGDLPGFFYRSPERKKIFRDRQGVGEVVYAFALGCEELKDEPDRGKWIEVLRRYAGSYAPKAAEYNAPYRIMPFGLYDVGEAGLLLGAEQWWVDPWDPRAFAEFPGGDEYNVRIGGRFLPRIRGGRWGKNRFLLREAIGLAAASRVLRDPGACGQALRHVDWMLGLNPFSMTMVWGEGHRSPVPYCPMPGLMVGSVYPGIGSLDNNRPYFSPQIYCNQREVWTIGGGEFVWAVAEIESARRACGR